MVIRQCFVTLILGCVLTTGFASNNDVIHTTTVQFQTAVFWITPVVSATPGHLIDGQCQLTRQRFNFGAMPFEKNQKMVLLGSVLTKWIGPGYDCLQLRFERGYNSKAYDNFDLIWDDTSQTYIGSDPKTGQVIL